jgi:plastocyanin
MLLVGALCAVCGASVAIAFGAPSSTARHEPPSSRRVCRRTKRHPCQMKHSRNSSRHKHRLSRHAKSAAPASERQGASQPGQGTVGSGVAKSPTSGSSAVSGPAEPGVSEKTVPVKPPAASAPAHVEVTAEDSEGFRFVLSRSSVPAGKTIIEFVNHGQDEHNLNAAEGSEGEVVGSLPNTPSNGHLSLTVDLKPGSYTLFCSLPGHAAKGMKATLTVE